MAVLNGVRASFFETFIFFFQIRMKNGTKSVWDYPTLFLWDHPTFFSIYPTSIPQKGVVHFCRQGGQGQSRQGGKVDKVDKMDKVDMVDKDQVDKDKVDKVDKDKADKDTVNKGRSAA